jgi:hypothetical protein
MPRTTQSQPWERQPGESGKAFHAFQCYLFMPADSRSVFTAHRDYYERRRSGSETVEQTTLHQWNKWCHKFGWVARAEAYDDEQFQIELREIERERKRLAIRRARQEVKWQERIEARADALDTLIEKWAAMPPTDVVVEKNTTDPSTGQTTTTVQKVKGYRGSDLAKVIAEWRNLMATGVHGFIRITRSERVGDEGDNDKAPAAGGGGRLELILDEWPDGNQTGTTEGA